MILKFQGKNMETVGTCLFFANSEFANKDPSDGDSEINMVEKSNQSKEMDEKDVEMSDHCTVQDSLEMSEISETKNGKSDIVNDANKSRLIYIGKCKKVVQAFIED